MENPSRVPSPPKHHTGILKQWNAPRRYGIIYCPEGVRYFLHLSKVIEGTPELGRRVMFDVGAPRNASASADLLPAVNAVIGEKVGRQW